MTHPIDTQSDCPSLDSSLSGSQSATPTTPSPSFSNHGASTGISMAWYSSQSPGCSPHPVEPTMLKPDTWVLPTDFPMSHEHFASANVLDEMTFLSDKPDLVDRHQIVSDHGLPGFDPELDCTEYPFAQHENPFQRNLSPAFGGANLPEGLPLTAYNHCLPQQVVDDGYSGAWLTGYHDAGPYTSTSTDCLPQTVVPSQTITEPMTPYSTRGQIPHHPRYSEGSQSPMELLSEYEPLTMPSPDASPVEVSIRMSALTLRGGFGGCGPVAPVRSRSTRRIKREPGVVRRSFDDIPVIPSNKPFPCAHPRCNKPGEKPRKFGRLEHLRRHERSLHSDDKPFQCPYCEKRFPRQDNYRAHKDTHAKSNGRNTFIEEEFIHKQRRDRTKKLKQIQRRSKL